MQRLFSATGKATSEMGPNWSALSAREFYDGDVEIESGDNQEFIFEKALSYPAALTHLTTNCGVSFRRTWKHIRNNNVGFRGIWFVVRGSLKISRSEGAFEIKEGEAGILDVGAPCHCKIMHNESGYFESYQLIVPSYLFVEHLHGADHIPKSFSLDTAEGAVVRHMLKLLVQEGEHLGRKVAKPLVDGLLEAIADCIGHGEIDVPRRQSLVDKRLADIESFILMNLTDPDLCYDRVATNCGISPRYLCYVLKANNTSFSEMLWKNRLPMAKDLLMAPATRDFPIHEIAFMSGFKSAAHFSRMFKAAYGHPPREFRNANGANRAEMPTMLVAPMREPLAFQKAA